MLLSKLHLVFSCQGFDAATAKALAIYQKEAGRSDAIHHATGKKAEGNSVRSVDQALGAGAYVKKPYVIEKLGLAVKKELDRAM